MAGERDMGVVQKVDCLKPLYSARYQAAKVKYSDAFDLSGLIVCCVAETLCTQP